MSLLRQNDVVTSFWRNKDVIITSYVRCVNVMSSVKATFWRKIYSVIKMCACYSTPDTLVHTSGT